MIKNIYKLQFILLTLSFSSLAMAMQPLEDHDLASSIGQDGITIGIKLPNSTLRFDQIRLADTDGASASHMNGQYGNSASFAIAPWNFNETSAGVRFLSATGNEVSGDQIQIRLDAESNNNQPVLNANVALSNNVRQIVLPNFSIYLSPDVNNIFSVDRVLNGAYQAKRTEVKELFSISTVTIDLGAQLAINFQFGHQPQGNFMSFSSGTLKQVTIPQVDIISYNPTRSNLTLSNIVLKGNSSNAIAGEVRLTGIYGQMVNDEGFSFGKVGELDKFDITIGSVVAGCSNGCIGGTGIFNNTKNGSMGSFGVIGTKVTDFKATVKGM